MRVLSHTAGEHHAQDVQDGSSSSQSTLQLRLIAMAVILVGGLLGVIPPIIGKWMANPDAVPARTVRSFSGGTILALALIHIIPEAFEQLGSLTDYPIGGLPVVLGLLSLLFLDFIATWLLTRRISSSPDKHNSSSSSRSHCVKSSAFTDNTPTASCQPPHLAQQLPPPLQQQHAASLGPCCPRQVESSVTQQQCSRQQQPDLSIIPTTSHQASLPGPTAAAAAGAAALVVAPADSTTSVPGRALSPTHLTMMATTAKGGHNLKQDNSSSSSTSGGGNNDRDCAASPVPAAAAAAALPVAPIGSTPFAHSHHHLPSCQVTTIKHYMACFTMELGCVFHSVIIGVGIGVITDSPQLVSTMMAVMVFHQAVEGLALGSVLACTRLPLLKKLAMGVLYALTLPVGIAIGIRVAGSYDHSSDLSAAVQGALNGVSGGMLLYVSLYSLLGEEFSKADLLLRPGLAAVLMLSVLLGVGGMCVIGIWG